MPASSTQATDQVQYDGRKYDYVVTATNGADLESPNSAVQSFTSIGIPSTPSVDGATPTNDEKVRLDGQPRPAPRGRLHGRSLAVLGRPLGHVLLRAAALPAARSRITTERAADRETSRSP